ncbi:RNA polymerase, sigma 30 subunit, SigH [Marinitoga hydrogenitolerans DSM 16785]|uniref:RNA polymerase, sigma 30 subunit, SigH n=1 Tax=Marinitoga hydrogenitolerans (strain DSM 16785 / JCM 12826 / AT1271) TaxID=1122195 RepID=A0A1M4U7J8_MARH1|nr:sigma-70 family RNA polymerase sigma factor [Marinitoga hydrogenitolerans]SHE52567.1 RNA polymerase, sigma 30 subunit, SigH [Marinitoga hydrogenitolerans DSM 16785]
MSKYKLRTLRVESLIKLAQSGDKEAMNMIMVKFEPMIKSIASKYYGAWAEFQDLVQIGFVGLIQGVYSFDENNNTKFSTFAYLNISSEIKSFLTYLNRLKNKVLSDAVSIESMFEDYSEDSDYYFEVPSETDLYQSVVYNYIFERSIEQMKEIEKDIVKMWLDNNSYEEISEELNIAKKKVDNTIQKFKKVANRVMKYVNASITIGGK